VPGERVKGKGGGKGEGLKGKGEGKIIGSHGFDEFKRSKEMR